MLRNHKSKSVTLQFNANVCRPKHCYLTELNHETVHISLFPRTPRERSPSPSLNPPTPQSTDSQTALSETSTAPITAATTPKRRRCTYPDSDTTQSLRRSTRNTSGGDRAFEGGGSSSSTSPQPRRRGSEAPAPLPKFFLNLEKSEYHFINSMQSSFTLSFNHIVTKLSIW